MLNPRGFTIVEVIVALLVLAVGLLGTISTFAAAARNFEAGHSSISVSVRAAELLESARARGCSDVVAGSTNDGIGVFHWRAEHVNADLFLVTLVFNPSQQRSRADTFSAILPC